MELHAGPKATADDLGIVYLFGKIDTLKSDEVIRKIIDLNHRGIETIQLLINSPGGEVRAGFAMIDVMLWSRAPVRTTGLGIVSSMALMILMAGEPRHRVLTPRVSILSHRHSGGAPGTYSELVASRREDDLVHQKIVEHYQQFSKVKNAEKLRKTLLREVDTWLTPQEAVRFGLADRIEERLVRARK